ncbi:MAG TPA: recombinase family protein [Terriglobales bacterium]
MNKPAAIYARVSSDRQKENHTIASQTAALIEYAQKNGYSVPPEWVFQDEGYSGAILGRPGLEALRDLAAEGQIAAALIYSPDRLSRKYAYQILLSEELSRCGVELIFLKAPAGATPEDQLLVQFQGMIAEYERAQIAERCRRGKKHMAQQGGVNVCRWRRKRGPVWRVGRDHLRGYAMDFGRITPIPGFSFWLPCGNSGCLTATASLSARLRVF